MAQNKVTEKMDTLEGSDIVAEQPNIQPDNR